MPPPTSSPWSGDPAGRQSDSLNRDAECDVCVVGGGIAGLTTAYLLADAGVSVTVLEASEAVAGGETEFTTAHLAWVLDDRFARLKSIRGADTAKAAADSHRGAIDLIERIARKERIDCEFERVDGHLVPGAKDGTVSIDDEEKALRELGIPYKRMSSCGFPSLPPGPCLTFEGNAQFHPLKYLAGLTVAIRNKGGMIHTGTRVEKIAGGEPCRVHTANKHTVTAKQVVIATGSPFDAGVTLHTKLAAYNTYAVGLDITKGSVPHALYWDTEDPYHYVRVRPATGSETSDLLIVGGEDHKTGQEHDQAARWARLVAWAKARVPSADGVRHRWSGQVFETPDGLGLIGRAPWGKNLYVICGDSGMGLTHGTLGARLVANLIRGEADPLARVYDPSRWMPGALKTFLQENLKIAAQYADWLTGGDVSSEDQIPAGHGAVVRSGLTKHAVYRDKGGKLTRLTAVCPHMGGLVRWNPGEQTWDCPCHGSRFTCEGEVLHGPAVSGLEVVKGS
jgi:glycine/D-amino acid oxidase-like deaminating enzyme/nitrite reductase/ring-hydroxylating ferredoxin subunit